MSYFSQMVGLAFHNFVSAATGIAIAAALVRAIARHSATTLGNFWVDLVRVTYYLLLPICLVFAVFLVSQGMIQNFKPYTKATLVEPMKIQVEKKNDKGETIKGPDGKAVTEEQTVTDQNIVQGPMASQVAIKMLGTNGGGYVNANAAHPFENPTPLSNFFQMLSIFSIGSGLTYYLGRMVKNQKHGWTVWAAMLILFVGGVLLCWWAEANGNPIHQSLGVAGGNMEGKEVRFGIFNSALFATVTTDASCGAVNSMHDSFTALGGFVPLFNIQLGEVIFGGVGAGLYGMLVFVVLAVFIAGLMVGRTPEYLGKKIEAYDVKMAMLALLILAISILGFAAWAAVAKWGLAGLNNSGPHGLSEILYAFSSGAGNNGSAFAGLSGKYAALQHNAWSRHVVRPIPHDRADHGAGGLAGAKESRAAKRRHVPGLRRDVSDSASRNRALDRCAQFSPRARLWGPSSSISSCRAENFFNSGSNRYDAKTCIAFRLEHCRSGYRRRIQKTEPAADGEEPGHVCDHGRRRPDDRGNFYR